MWESIMYAGTHGLDNLISYFDINRIQSYNRIEECSEVEPVADKLKSFHWNVIEVKGYDIEEVGTAYDKAKALKNGKPTAIVGHTVIGNGVSFLEDNPDCSGVGGVVIACNIPSDDYNKINSEKKPI